MPFFAPASIAMLHKVNLESMERASIVLPVNSRVLYVAPLAPIIDSSLRIMSLDITPWGSVPLTFTRMVSGTLNHSSPVVMTAHISVDPIPVEKPPSAP